MKKSITTILIFFFIISLYAQTKPSDFKPKGMQFIPEGSFQITTIRNSEPKVVYARVGAFWMSNEITNAEYREFVDWANKNPGKILNQVKYSNEVVSDPKKGTMRDTIIVKRISIQVSTFNSTMIDPLSLEKANKEYKGYFTDQKFDDYPVVGVSFKMAEYFCLWKTMIENEQMKEKGLPKNHLYRIPMEAEWEYVAQQPISKKDKNSIPQPIQKVKEGNSNDFGLFHLNDNVSEWIVTTSGNISEWVIPTPGQVCIRGGSWRSENSISERHLINEDSKEPYIGFRIVQSYITDNK